MGHSTCMNCFNEGAMGNYHPGCEHKHPETSNHGIMGIPIIPETYSANQNEGSTLREPTYYESASYERTHSTVRSMEEELIITSPPVSSHEVDAPQSKDKYELSDASMWNRETPPKEGSFSSQQEGNRSIENPASAIEPVSEPARQTDPISEPARQVDPISEPARQVDPISEPARQVDPISEQSSVAIDLLNEILAYGILEESNASARSQSSMNEQIPFEQLCLNCLNPSTTGIYHPQCAPMDGEWHHLASNKHSYWSPLFEDIFREANIKLTDEINLAYIESHAGRHVDEYHSWVAAELQDATDGKSGESYRQGLLERLEDLADWMRQHPEVVRTEFWRGKDWKKHLKARKRSLKRS